LAIKLRICWKCRDVMGGRIGRLRARLIDDKETQACLLSVRMVAVGCERLCMYALLVTAMRRVSVQKAQRALLAASAPMAGPRWDHSAVDARLRLR